MTVSVARQAATAVLLEIIKNQPNLFTVQTGCHISQGKEIAQFCEEFISTYAKGFETATTSQR